MSEFMNYLAMQKFIDSNWDEIRIKNHKEENCCGAQIHIAGQTFGLLGALAICVKNLMENNDMPMEVAFDFMKGVICSIRDGAFGSDVHEVQDGEDIEELMEMMKKNRQTRGQQ
jgi:hypothetical protein